MLNSNGIFKIHLESFRLNYVLTRTTINGQASEGWLAKSLFFYGKALMILILMVFLMVFIIKAFYG